MDREETPMVKVKLKIDLDNDFSVAASVIAFGREAGLLVTLRKVAGSKPRLSSQEVLPMAAADQSDLQPEGSTTPSQ